MTYHDALKEEQKITVGLGILFAFLICSLIFFVVYVATEEKSFDQNENDTNVIIQTESTIFGTTVTEINQITLKCVELPDYLTRRKRWKRFQIGNTNNCHFYVYNDGTFVDPYNDFWSWLQNHHMREILQRSRDNRNQQDMN